MRLFGAEDATWDPVVFNSWDLVHFMSGVTAYAVYATYFPGASFARALATWSALHVAYEAKDLASHAYREKTGYHTFPDSVGDQISATLGFWAAHATGLYKVFGVHVLALLTGVIALVVPCTRCTWLAPPPSTTPVPPAQRSMSAL